MKENDVIYILVLASNSVAGTEPGTWLGVDTKNKDTGDPDELFLCYHESKLIAKKLNELNELHGIRVIGKISKIIHRNDQPFQSALGMLAESIEKGVETL